MTLYISEKTAEENVKVLQEAAKTVFTWAEEIFIKPSEIARHH